MKYFIFIILVIGSTSTYAACSTQGVGGEHNVGNSGAETTNSNTTAFNSRVNKKRGGIEYGINCDEDPVDLPPMVVTGYSNPGGAYFWMGSARFFHLSHGGSGGGTPANSVTQAKLKYCKMKDKVTAMVSALPITGTIVTGYGIAQSSNQWIRAVMSTGYKDIQYWVSHSERFPGGYTNGTVNWNAAAINWHTYDNWSSNPNLNPTNALPTEFNGGAIHVFANFLLQTGKGNGTVNIITNNQDPQPNVAC